MMSKTTGAKAATRTEIVMPREGGPEVLEAHRRHLPGPGPGQVMVRVEAAGVSFAEVQMLKEED
jgi:synaptic vesicle membrane protein VAT-1